MILTLIYPFIFSLFPILSLYLRNYNEVQLTSVFQVFMITLFFASVIYVGSFLVVRDLTKTSLITFLFLFFIFSFGPFFSPFQKYLRFEELLDIYQKFFFFWILIFCFLITLVMLASDKVNFINKFLGLFSVFLVATALLRLVVLKPWLNTNVLSRTSEEMEFTPLQNGSDRKDFPDIYYIIMDRYMGNDILRSKYGFDNSDFLNFLKSRGFYVAEKSRSNYLKTAHSLASSLNMQYVNYLSEEVGQKSGDWRPLYSLIEKNTVAETLKGKGYKYIHIGSWWEPTRNSSTADVNVNSYIMSEFSQNLLKNTPFNSVYDPLFASEFRREQAERSIYEIEFIKDIPLEERPTFTFAHFLITHPPYVFDEGGNILSREDLSQKSEGRLYVMQIKYANKLLEEMVDSLLKKSTTKPVIVIQSDEGKYPVDNIQFNDKHDWFGTSNDKVEEKLSILNAIYIPGAAEEIFYPTMTPVNTFRIIFNQTFNTDMEILPDEIYLHRDNLDLYNFKKID